jgi:RimJ/RimL family protein N-acetyltransferase
VTTIRVDDRVRLSEPAAADVPFFTRHLRDRTVYDNTLLIPYPYTASDGAAFVRCAAERRRLFGLPMEWAIRLAPGTEPIGVAGFMGWGGRDAASDEMGFWLARAWRNRGIMTAVVGALTGWAFRERGLRRITMHVFASNAASRRVARKAGYRLEKRLPRYYFKDGRFIDAVLFSKTR